MFAQVCPAPCHMTDVSQSMMSIWCVQQRMRACHSPGGFRSYTACIMADQGCAWIFDIIVVCRNVRKPVGRVSLGVKREVEGGRGEGAQTPYTLGTRRLVTPPNVYISRAPT